MGKSRKRSKRRESDRIERKISKIVKKKLKERSRRHRRDDSSSSTRSGGSSNTRRESSGSSCSHGSSCSRRASSAEGDSRTSKDRSHEALEKMTQETVKIQNGVAKLTSSHVASARAPPAEQPRVRQTEGSLLPTAETQHSALSTTAEAATSSSTKAEEKSLKESVLSVIGQRLIEDRNFAPPIHSTFAVRWAEVLKVGLPDEERTTLIKKYPLPKNCIFLDPPKLNNEIKLSVNDIAKNRDKRIVLKQEKLQGCIGGLAKIIALLIEREKDDDVPIIEALSDVTRLVIDAMHDETAIRRSLILTNVNASMKEALVASEADDLLFGKKLSEVLKQAKLTGQDVQVLSKTADKINSSQPSKDSTDLSRQQNRAQTTPQKEQYRPTSTSHQKHQQDDGTRSPQRYEKRQQRDKHSSKNNYSRRR